MDQSASRLIVAKHCQFIVNVFLSSLVLIYKLEVDFLLGFSSHINFTKNVTDVSNWKQTGFVINFQNKVFLVLDFSLLTRTDSKRSTQNCPIG